MKRAFLIPATSLAFVAKAMPAHTGHEHTGGTDVKIIGEVIDPVCYVSHAGDEGKTFAREVAVEPETSRGAVEHPRAPAVPLECGPSPTRTERSMFYIVRRPNRSAVTQRY